MAAAKWTLRALVGAAGLTILVSGVMAQDPATPAIPAATVNGDEIIVYQVEAAVRALPPHPPDVTHAQLQQEALSLLIDELVMQQFLSKNAPRVGPDQVENRFQDFVASLKEQNHTLEEFYRETGQSEVNLRVTSRANSCGPTMSRSTLRRRTFSNIIRKITIFLTTPPFAPVKSPCASPPPPRWPSARPPMPSCRTSASRC